MDDERFHGGNLALSTRKYGLPLEKFIDFSASINPLGPSRNILEAVACSLDKICHYPDPECTELTDVLASYLNKDRSEIVVGNGTAELIILLAQALKIRRALIPAPTFSEYASAVRAAGGEAEYIPMDERKGFPLPVNDVCESLKGCDAVFICNPNNPTGRLEHASDIAAILKRASELGAVVIVDEAFMDFLPERSGFSLMYLAGRHDNLIVLYSLTKFFAIPGLRLGALIAKEDLIRKLKKLKVPWSVNSLAQVAGVAGLRDREYIISSRVLIKKQKDFLRNSLLGIPGFKPLPGASNFLMVDISETGYSSGEMVDLLGRQGILVRDCSNFPGLSRQYVRVAVRLEKENRVLIKALSSAVSKGDR